jgi:hypothetical protein
MRKFNIAAVAVAIAAAALIVAVWVALSERPPQPPVAKVVVKIADRITVDRPGTYAVNLGWIYVRDAAAAVHLTSDYEHIFFVIDGKMYGKAANVVLAPGNHTISAIVHIATNNTVINIKYQVVS